MDGTIDPQAWGQPPGEEAIPSELFFALIEWGVAEFGWTSRSAATVHLEATADRVWAIFADPALRRQIHLTDEQIRRGQAVLAWLRSDHFDATRRALNDYERALATAAREPLVTRRRAALLASAVNAFARHAGAPPRQGNVPSRHVGRLRQRVTLELMVDEVHPFENNWGMGWRHHFHDDAGNLYIWWANNGRQLASGTRYWGKATIKAHAYDPHSGAPQTVLTRCKLAPVDMNQLALDIDWDDSGRGG